MTLARETAAEADAVFDALESMPQRDDMAGRYGLVAALLQVAAVLADGVMERNHFDAAVGIAWESVESSADA